MSEPGATPPPNLAPYGTKRRMRMLAFVGPLLAVVLLLGGVMVADKRAVLLTIGGILLVFWAVMIPFARRRGKI